jgi:hypothetical protein
MPPKKKSKKAKKGKKQVSISLMYQIYTTHSCSDFKEEAPPEEASEYDRMSVEMLKEVTQMLKQQLQKCQMDRNYVQLERDTIQTFYNISKKEMQDLQMGVMSKDREMELMEDNHRVEVRVYIQKVKHLEYEHKNNIKRVNQEGGSALNEEGESHFSREIELKKAKKSLKLECKERELANQDEILQTKQLHDKNLSKLREQFQKNLDGLQDRCEARVTQLREDLELRRKVDIHEIEERKNLHINDLMKNHEKAFGFVNRFPHPRHPPTLSSCLWRFPESACSKKKIEVPESTISRAPLVLR